MIFSQHAIHSKKPISLPLFRLLESSGVFLGALFMLFLKVYLFPVFLYGESDLVYAFLLFWTTSIFYALIPLGIVFLKNGFFRFFSIGMLLFIYARSFHRLVTMGFGPMMLDGFPANNAVIIGSISLLSLFLLRFFWFKIANLCVERVPGVYAIATFDAESNFIGKFNDSPDSFFSTTRTKDELSVVTESKIFVPGCAVNDGLALFEFLQDNPANGSPNPLYAKILRPLDSVKIPYFSLSTYKRNYVLLEVQYIPLAQHAWGHSGVKVVSHG
ncbi:MAG: hypothetical protein ACRCVN_02895 [Spirochaetia bacterium]